MSKRCQDAAAGGGHEEDRGTVKNVMALIGANWFTTEKKEIVKVGNFERHAQHHKAFQVAALINMFENYTKSKGIIWAQVRSKTEIHNLLKDMFLVYGVQWYWDPTFVDPLKNRECDLLKSTRDQVIRLLWDLAFSVCEKENDSLGLRALRRIVIPLFRNKSKAATSKYSLYTLMDLIVELSASERTRERMNIHVTVNPSGHRGGGMHRFSDI